MVGEQKRRFGGKCEKCGSTENLEFAHIAKTPLKGKGRGSMHRYYDIKNHPMSYALMCHRCHEQEDILLNTYMGYKYRSDYITDIIKAIEEMYYK